MIKICIIITAIMGLNGVLFSKSIINEDNEIENLVPSRPTELGSLARDISISSASAIHQRYASLFESIAGGNFSLIELTNALTALTAQFIEVDDHPSYLKKRPLVQNFLKSVRQFLKSPNLFTEQSEEAVGMRKLMFFRLQKALEISGEDLIDTKDRTTKSLGRQ